MALHNQKWIEGSPICPWGHPREKCEQIYVNKAGRTKRSCRIERSQRDANRIYGKVIVRSKEISPSDLTVGERISSTRINNGIFKRSVTIVLVCGHYHYQMTHVFENGELMYCRIHQDWFDIHSITQYNQTLEVTPLLSRHELNGCTTKTGCTPRCKNQEVPPSVAAINNKAYSHATKGAQGGIIGRRLA